jgi:pyrimidine operon attenuation protein/uracil phosphoribosyltransferase
MALSQNCILNSLEIEHKILRMSYQIYECNINEKEIILAGILKNGFILAEKIKLNLEKISTIKIILCSVEVDKKNPINQVETNINHEHYKNKSVVLVDDVLHSGTTLIYGVKHFLDYPLKQFKTAVLVNRNHKKYPVKADFKGISLSTSINKHVEVVFSEKNSKVTLV